MTDIQLLLPGIEPDIGFHAHAACSNGGVERHFAPVIVVGMTRYGYNVAAEVCRPSCLWRSDCARSTPGSNDSLDVIFRYQPSEMYVVVDQGR